MTDTHSKIHVHPVGSDKPIEFRGAPLPRERPELRIEIGVVGDGADAFMNKVRALVASDYDVSILSDQRIGVVASFGAIVKRKG